MERSEYDVVLLDKSSITQQVQVFKQAFGLDAADDELLVFWKKKHYQNPLGNSLMFGIFIDGILAGMNAYMPSAFDYNGKTIKCLQSCESGVNPAFQGKGIWGTIVRYAVDYIFRQTEYEFIFGFPNYRNSYPGFVKMKWDVLENMKNFILINNPSAFVKTITSKSIACALSFPLLLQKLFVKISSSRKLIIEECTADELIWNCDEDHVSVKPTKEWIEWKADYRNEHFLKVQSEKKVVATCIYILDNYNGESVVRLDRVDIANNGEVKPKKVLASVLTYLTKKYPQTAFIRIWTTEKSFLYEIFKNLYLLKSSHPNPFILKQKDYTYKDVKWNLSFYDLD